ncbi:hypothetical protein [Sandaracinobacteroides saxicola]|uniref:DUF2269 family protein n=1 Tax=Sandaracinobacteroides saxicola TaxID=2759707 RepID=A0A7G5IGL3_9SPHN|nr:hypothetical protein [Sandaracinobacteroides saxicola]QMW22505.1 hypothetical protein H3309_14380 [Sandaracinobacteroides saxicola]
MDWSALYPTLVYVHVLLFVFWLGADLGVFLLGQHFRRRDYSIQERLTVLKLLVINDMGPRTAWALMVPSSLFLLKAGGHWPDIPDWLLVASLVIGLSWLTLVWDAFLHDQTPRAACDRKIENILKYLLTGFYLTLGTVSILHGEPLAGFIAWKALLFGAIFVAAIMIDVWFKPVGPLLVALVQNGSSDETEIPLRRQMDRTRIWVFATYVLLVVTSYLGVTKPF